MSHTVTQKIAVIDTDGRIIKWFNHTRSEIIKDLAEQGTTARGPDDEVIGESRWYNWGGNVKGGRVVYDFNEWKSSIIGKEIKINLGDFLGGR